MEAKCSALVLVIISTPRDQSLKHMEDPLSLSYKTCEHMELLWAMGLEVLIHSNSTLTN